MKAETSSFVKNWSQVEHKLAIGAVSKIPKNFSKILHAFACN